MHHLRLNIALYLNVFYISQGRYIIKLTFTETKILTFGPETKILTFEILCIHVILNSVCHEAAAFKHATLIFFLVDSLMMQTAGRDLVATLISV